MVKRLSLLGLLLVSSMDATIGVAQTENTNYRTFHSKNSLELFDEEVIDTPAPTAKPNLISLGWLESSAACNTATLPKSFFIPTAAAACVDSDDPEACENSGLLLSVDRNVLAHAKAIKTIGTGTFVFLYRVTFKTGDVLTEWSHPLNAISCGLTALSNESVGKVADGIRTGNSADITYGATMTLATLVTMGAGVEAFQGTTLFGKLQNAGRNLEGAAGNFVADLSNVVRNGNSLALQPQIAFAGAIPIARIAEVGATGSAALGNIMMMSAVTGHTNGKLIRHERFIGAGNRPPEGISKTYERKDATNVDSSALKKKSIGEEELDSISGHEEAEVVTHKDHIETVVSHFELKVGDEVVLNAGMHRQGFAIVYLKQFGIVRKIFSDWIDGYRVVVEEGRRVEKTIGIKNQVIHSADVASTEPKFVQFEYKTFQPIVVQTQ